MTSYLVYSTVALSADRKIHCGNSCRRISFSLCLVWERRSHTSIFSNAYLCLTGTIFGQKLSTNQMLFYRPFLSTFLSILLSLIIFFNLLCSRPISKIALPRCSRFSYKKLNGWKFGHWLIASFMFPDVT